MKFTINSKTFLSAASALGKLVPTKPIIAIQGSFLVSVQNGSIEIAASDPENYGTITESCETEGEGKFCIDARFIADILNAMPNVPVTVDVDGENTATISAATGLYRTCVAKGDEYPQSNFSEAPVAEFSMPTDKLIGGISDVAFAIGADAFHPQMMGVCMDIKQGDIVFCATDTRQLAKSVQGDCQIGESVETKCILSQKTISAINAFASKASSISVAIYPTSIEFKGDGFTLRSQLVLGNFPPYDKVIPADNNIAVTISRADLANAIRRVSICADQQYCLIRFQFSSGLINVTAQDVVMGKKAKDVVACDYDGPSFVMGFSCKHLMGILKSVPTESVVFKINDNSRPAIIQPSGDDQHLTLLLMPMSVKE